MGLSGHIKSFTTASVFPIMFFFVVFFFIFSCIAGFIGGGGGIRHREPSLTKPAPSLISLHRYNLPVGKRGGSCAIEIVVDNGTARRLQDYVSHPASEVMRPACNQLNALSSNYVKLASQSTVCAASPFPEINDNATQRVRRSSSDSVTLAITGSTIKEIRVLIIPSH